MTPLTTLLTTASPDLPDPLELQLCEEHRIRYERIKAWRQAQKNPQFREVPSTWHACFDEKYDD